MVYVHILILILGLIFLVKGSDVFVEAASRIAKRFGISELMIGLTLVAIGTSIPELASSIVAAFAGSSGLIIGNVIGSNVANIGVIIGLTALFYTIKTNEHVLKRDSYMMIFATLLFYIFAFNNSITWKEGIVLLVMYVAYILFLIRSKMRLREYHFKEFLPYVFKFEYLKTIHEATLKRILQKKSKKELLSSQEKKVWSSFKGGLIKDVFLMVISLVFIVFGAKYLINEAIWLAEFLNVPKNIVGLSIVALGTSLPELSVSLRAAKKGFGEMVVGNILGSNIANILLILGISSFISPLSVVKETLTYTLPFMIGISLLFVIMIKSKWKVGRLEGLFLSGLYVLFMWFVFSSF